jgi:hypothetical protein
MRSPPLDQAIFGENSPRSRGAGHNAKKPLRATGVGGGARISPHSRSMRPRGSLPRLFEEIESRGDAGIAGPPPTNSPDANCQLYNGRFRQLLPKLFYCCPETSAHRSPNRTVTCTVTVPFDP